MIKMIRIEFAGRTKPSISAKPCSRLSLIAMATAWLSEMMGETWLR